MADAATAEDGGTVDAVPFDGGLDGGVDAAIRMQTPLPTLISVSSGGGSAMSNSYRAVIRVGGPLPSGSAASAHYHLGIGPNAGSVRSER